MVTIKVKDGTPESRGTLCTTCRSARVVKGYRAGEMEGDEEILPAASH